MKDYAKEYGKYLNWRIKHVNSGTSVRIGFDREYFRTMDLDELIGFREYFIENSIFVPTAKEMTLDSMDTIILEKVEERRDERIDEIIG